MHLQTKGKIKTTDLTESYYHLKKSVVCIFPFSLYFTLVYILLNQLCFTLTYFRSLILTQITPKEYKDGINLSVGI